MGAYVQPKRNLKKRLITGAFGRIGMAFDGASLIARPRWIGGRVGQKSLIAGSITPSVCAT